MGVGVRVCMYAVVYFFVPDACANYGMNFDETWGKHDFNFTA